MWKLVCKIDDRATDREAVYLPAGESRGENQGTLIAPSLSLLDKSSPPSWLDVELIQVCREILEYQPQKEEIKFYTHPEKYKSNSYNSV